MNPERKNGDNLGTLVVVHFFELDRSPCYVVCTESVGPVVGLVRGGVLDDDGRDPTKGLETAKVHKYG